MPGWRGIAEKNIKRKGKTEKKKAKGKTSSKRDIEICSWMMCTIYFDNVYLIVVLKCP